MTSPAATCTGFITIVMRSTSDGSRPAKSGTARTNSCSSDLGATGRNYSDVRAILGGMIHLQRLQADGFVVLERAVGDDVLAQVRAELAPYLGESALHGRNDFEGYSTNRVYALLAKAPSIARLVEHDDVVALLDELLLPNYLLSANLAINLLPGETAQSLHSDDGFYRLPGPARRSASARSGRSTTSRSRTERRRSSPAATGGGARCLPRTTNASSTW